MRERIPSLIGIVLAGALLALVLTACTPGGSQQANASPIPGTTTPTPEPAPTATDAPTATAPPSATLAPSPTPTVLPTYVMPPTPAPPSETWARYTHPESGLAFRYPENWFIYPKDETLYIANFHLDGLPLKGRETERIKIDLYLTPEDISAYPDLPAYLEAQEQQIPADAPGGIVEQIAIPHEDPAYEVIRQTRSGLMGQADATYEVIYIASGGILYRMTVYDGTQYLETAEKIAASLRIP